MQTSRKAISRIKNLLLPTGEKLRVVQTGLFKGLRYPLDLSRETQVYLGLYEREVYSDVPRLTKGVKTFIDVGAASGLMTVYGLARTNATRVLAFEPQESLCEKIRAAAAANGYDRRRLEIHSCYIGDNKNLEARSLDSYSVRTDYPCFIKIDVDGPESSVLRGAEQVLQEDCRLLIETHSLSGENECIAILERLGYTVKTIPNAWWRIILPEQRPIPHNRWLAAWR